MSMESSSAGQPGAVRCSESAKVHSASARGSAGGLVRQRPLSRPPSLPHRPQTQTDAPEPRALLQELAGLMQESGFGPDHPWCMAVVASLTAHPVSPSQAPGTSPAAGAACLFRGLAEHADDLCQTLREIIGGKHEFLGVAETAACHIGWLCDVAAVAHGGEAWKDGGAEEWFLPPAAGGALEAARQASVSEGGAA